MTDQQAASTVASEKRLSVWLLTLVSLGEILRQLYA